MRSPADDTLILFGSKVLMASSTLCLTASHLEADFIQE